jgi:hypothetical protein
MVVTIRMTRPNRMRRAPSGICKRVSKVRRTVRISAAQSNKTGLSRAGCFVASWMTKRSPIRYFKTSPEIIRRAVMMYVRFSLSIRTFEDLLHERGIEISYETVRFCGSDLARCLLPRFGENGRAGCRHIQTGSDTWTRSS